MFLLEVCFIRENLFCLPGSKIVIIFDITNYLKIYFRVGFAGSGVAVSGLPGRSLEDRKGETDLPSLEVSGGGKVPPLLYKGGY